MTKNPARLRRCQFHRLWTNPDLRPFVRHVGLDSATRLESTSGPRPDLIRGGVDENRTYLSVAVMNHLGMDLTDVSPPIPSSMAQWCRESAVPLFLLLSMAPNVKSVRMYMHCGWEVDHGLVQRLPDGTFAPKVVFPNLTSLRLWSYSWIETSVPERCKCRDAIACFLVTVPNLTSLELSGFGALEDRLPLPPRLTSFALIDTYYVSGSDLEAMTRQVPQLKRFYVLRENRRRIDPSPAFFSTHFLDILSRSNVAGTLVTLGLCGSRLDIASVDMGRFQCLKVLGVKCATNPWPGSNLLIKLIKECNLLRSLMLDGADTIPREEMVLFAQAISQSACPTLRQVLLNVRDVRQIRRPAGVPTPHPGRLRYRAVARLRDITSEPVPDLFARGNVELFLHDGRNKGMVNWFTAMEAESHLCSIFDIYGFRYFMQFCY